jgi:hypothetical protein
MPSPLPASSADESLPGGQLHRAGVDDHAAERAVAWGGAEDAVEVGGGGAGGVEQAEEAGALLLERGDDLAQRRPRGDGRGVAAAAEQVDPFPRGKSNGTALT